MQEQTLLQVRPFLAMLNLIRRYEMSKSISFVVLIAALLVSSCSALSSQQVLYTPPALTDGWTVNMIQSGGIMGMKRSIFVSSDGSYTIMDLRTEKTVSSTLTDAQLTGLKAMITAIEFSAPQIPSAACADCFMYDIEIQGSGQKMIVQLDDTSLPDSAMEPLVDFLIEVMNTALK